MVDSGSNIEKIMPNPKSGECCVVYPGQQEGLRPDDSITWDATDCPKDLKIQFPNETLFGVPYLDLAAGQTVSRAIVEADPGSTIDYEIVIVDTMAKVKTEGGVEPTIIIGD